MLFPKPVAALHDPTGIQANSGTVYSGSAQMVAFVKSGYDSNVWTYVSAHEYNGDFDFHGDRDGGIGTAYLEFYCLIKIKPADSSHKYLQLSIDADFLYGISSGWLSVASWEAYWVVVDMGQSTPIVRGWSSYHPGDSVSWSQKNSQSWSSSTGYKDIYDSLYFNDYYEFSTSQYYFVGIWLRAGLSGFSEFYKTSWPNGNADWDTHYISWNFFT
ncbi:MAG: hypothetical protein BAJATHORv1_10291 [Candidatus Thorarchaeota archaeon]|nr:MAG: hypothetical protein BAJATHORv1_10291 [Candidatus Thorarchaeota archaeon]